MMRAASIDFSRGEWADFEVRLLTEKRERQGGPTTAFGCELLFF
jgi:hypothetical protein